MQWSCAQFIPVSVQKEVWVEEQRRASSFPYGIFPSIPIRDPRSASICACRKETTSMALVRHGSFAFVGGPLVCWSDCCGGHRVSPNRFHAGIERNLHMERRPRCNRV